MNEFRLLFYLKPMVSSRKVALLDDADFLNQESANSFLKTLEEPPPGMVLFLIGNERKNSFKPYCLAASRFLFRHCLPPKWTG